MHHELFCLTNHPDEAEKYSRGTSLGGSFSQQAVHDSLLQEAKIHSEAHNGRGEAWL